MMRRAFALALLLGLAGCNRHGVADVTLDAADAQRNATAAKTLADLQAANDAAQGPAPAVRDTRPAATPERALPAAPEAGTAEEDAAPPPDDAVGADTNG